MLISGENIANIQESTTNWTLRAYCPQNFHDSDGNLVLASHQDSQGAYFSSPFTTNDVPDIELPTTTDSLDNTDSRYSILGIYDASGALRYTLITDFFIDANLDSPITLSELLLSNRRRILSYGARSEYYTADTCDLLFQLKSQRVIDGGYPDTDFEEDPIDGGTP